MKHISVQELKEILNQQERGNSLVIDVRTAEEHAAVRIPQVVSMPLSEIEHKIEDLRKYETVYIHCQSGHRSQQACARLESLGLTNLVDVTGGIGAWEKLGLAVMRGR